MPVVASVDYDAKRIFLHADTANADVDTLDVYREVRALRRLTASHQRYRPMIAAGGNIAKIPGVSYTAPYVVLLYGCEIVPYGGASHGIRVVRDTFSDDGRAGEQCFNRAILPVGIEVDIDVAVDKVEVRLVSSGSGLSPEQDAKLAAVLARVNALPVAADIAAAVWNADYAQYLATGTIGKRLADEFAMIADVWAIEGLDTARPMTVTPTARTAGGINLAISGNGVTSTTVQRQ